MPISLPNNLIISNVTVRHEVPTFLNQSINKKKTTKERGIHRLSGSFDVYVGDDDAKKNLESFILQLRGRANPFYLSLSGRFSNLDVSGVLVNGTSSIGTTNMSFDSFIGTIKSGDFFTFANHDKVYMMLSDLTGSGSVEIYPPLYSQIPDNTVVNLFDVNVLVRMTSDIQEISYGNAGFIHTMTINWEEDL